MDNKILGKLWIGLTIGVVAFVVLQKLASNYNNWQKAQKAAGATATNPPTLFDSLSESLLYA